MASVRGVVGEPVAVVGLSCRLPQAPDENAFWRLLAEGRCAVGRLPDRRIAQLGLSGPAAERPGGYLDAVDGFDAEFFGLSPREAEAMDPQQRLALELAWEAVEDAGLPHAQLRGSRSAVLMAAIWGDYPNGAWDADGAPRQAFAGTLRSMLANRISYLFDLRGPSLTVDSGQSSSLLAVHQACASLRAGECDLALAGGVNLLAGRLSALVAESFGGLSDSGLCRAFDAAADGYVRGEGGGVVVLRRLGDALAAGESIRALILGSAVGSGGAGAAEDGGGGLTVPGAEAQREVILRACAEAGIRADQVRYVEAHGTGTRVGDPVEARALGEAYGPGRATGGQRLLVGSAKTNVGHLEGAAGIIGLIKAVLAVEHSAVPASLHFTDPNPLIDFDALGLEVPTRQRTWRGEDGPLICAVSAFGVGGTNCHAILGPAPEDAVAGGGAGPVEDGPTQDAVLAFPVTAHTRAALSAQAGRLRVFLEEGERPRRDRLARALAARTVFGRRAVVVARDDARLDGALDALAAGLPAANLVEGTAATDSRPVFVFPGQGAQWVGMAVELSRSSAAFRDALDECVAVLRPYTGPHLADVLADASGHYPLESPEVVQPAQFAVMVALARLWEHHGVRPRAVLGHSQGEIAAAFIAGRLSLEDAALIVCRRGHALRRIAGRGGMAAVDAPEARVRELMNELAASGAPDSVVYLAVRNGPASCVVSGALEALGAFERLCVEAGERVRRVPVDFPSHSPFVEEVRAELIDAFAPLRSQPEGEIAFYSSLTGGAASAVNLDAEYWYRNLREPVNFAGAVASAAADGCDLFIECSPHPVLTGSIGAAAGAVLGAADARRIAAVESLRRGDGGMERFLTSLATAFVHGADVDWAGGGGGRRAEHEDRLRLPGYAFQRRPFWAQAGAAPGDTLSQGPHAVASTTSAAQEPESAEQQTIPASGQPPLDLVAAHTAAVLGHPSSSEVDVDRRFRDLGFDSPAVVELASRLAGATGLPLTASFVFDHPTPRRAAAGLAELLGEPAKAGPAPARTARSAVPDPAHEPIAIVGMGIRLPGGVGGPDEFWDLLMQERDVIGPLPTDRGWDLARVYHPDPDHPGTSYTRFGGFLEDVAGFDAEFFGISPREALAMDPQQRLLLEVTWEALEHAGIDPHSLRDTDTSVYTGIMASDYGPRMAEASADLGGFVLTGNAGSVASGRVAYVLGLGGAAVSVDTACSSSLVALHVGVGALRRGECGLALVGGVAVMSSAGLLVEFSRARGLSVDGRCVSFGEGASGTGWSEGVGVLVVERLSDAVRLGRRVWGVVGGSAVNQDGGSNGLTAPSGVAQVGVVRGALVDAGVSVSGVDVVEGHGTGTVLGDPVEVGALSGVFGGSGGGSVLLGSVKSVVGHVQAAAGVVGVVKMVLGLSRGVVPGSLGGVGSSRAVWEGVELVSGARVWPDRGRVRRAGVSSFGISGTNAHVVLEQAPPRLPAPDTTTHHTPDGAVAAEDRAPRSESLPAGDELAAPVIWPLSARTPAALADAAARLVRHLERHPELSGGSVAAGLARRSRFAHRAAVHADHRAALAALAAGHPSPGLALGATASRLGARQGRGIVFVFPGQGSQYPDMTREVFETSAAFRRHIELCAVALAAHTDWSLLDLFNGSGLDLDRPDVVQPALFAVNTGLVEFWREYGIRPSAVIGHSQGEIAAAYCAGVLSLEDAAMLAARRSALVYRRLSGRGGMASVAAGGARTAELITAWAGRLHVAAYNGPESTVVSGEPAALAELGELCARHAVRFREIAVDYASHGPQVEELEDELLAALSGLAPGRGNTTFYSTVEAAPLDGTALDAAYWQRNLRSPVLFTQTVAQAVEAGYDGFVEVSPHPVLVPAIAGSVEGIPVVPTLRRDAPGPGAAVASVFVHGLPVQWPERAEEPADLPTYPFQHSRYWLAPPPASGQTMVDPGDADGDLYTLEWELADLAGSGKPRRATPIAFFDAMPDSGTAVDGEVDPARLAHAAARKALMRVREHLEEPRSGVLAVVTRGAVAVRPGDAIAPEALAASSVLGLVRAAQREQPGRLLLIDADPDVEPSDLRDLAGAALASGHGQVAVRQGRILVPRLRVRAGTDGTARGVPRLTAGGTVLITGGTGALGALTARRLAERAGVSRLLLLSRQGPDAPGAAELLKDLAGAGAEADIVSCDAADADRLRDVLAAIDPEHPLCAVIHTAGVLDDAIFADLTPDRLEATMRPKAHAAWNLHALTAHLPLDAFVLYSSVMGVLGNAGQANYCAANTFLDALAQHRRSHGLPAVSIAWGFWSRTGAMTGGLSEADRCRLNRLGLVALADDRGMELLRRALAESADAVLVAAGLDVLTLVEQRAAGSLPPALRGLLPEDDGVHKAAAPGVTAKSPGETAAAESDDDADPFGAMSAEERRAAVEELVRRHVAAALGHPDPWTLPMDRGLADLGLTSMAGLELRTRLAVALGTSLPSTLIFDHPTARAVARYADTLRARADAAPWQAASRALDELTGLVAALLSATGGADGASAGGTDDAGSAVARRLRELAARLDSGPPPVSAANGGGAPEPETDAAQDDLQLRISQAGSQELMALLDRELAGARVPDHDVEGG